MQQVDWFWFQGKHEVSLIESPLKLSRRNESEEEETRFKKMKRKKQKGVVRSFCICDQVYLCCRIHLMSSTFVVETNVQSSDVVCFNLIGSLLLQ